MSRHRFFLTEPIADPRVGAVLAPSLSAEDVRHAVRALRLRIAEEIDLVEPTGISWRVRVTTVGDEGISVELLQSTAAANEPDVTLIFGVLKGSKNDDVIEGAVEVGVSGLMPVLFERCIVRLDAEKAAERGDRWRRVARAAAKQAKRSQVPSVADPIGGNELARLLGEFDATLVAWEESDAAGVASTLAELDIASDARVAVVVGPEGGLSSTEVAALEAVGARAITLGATILRAETAGVVAAALVVYGLGGLGNRR